MPENKSVNIKLELTRDDNGKMRLVAHFNSKAPNIFIDKNEYVWMPTNEEKDLINEAFGFIPANTSPPKDLKTISTDEIEAEISSEIKKDAVPQPEPEIVFEKEPLEESKIKATELKQPDEPSVFEKINGDHDFEVTKQEQPEPKLEDRVEEPKNEMEPKVEVKKEEDVAAVTELDEGKGIIVEADEEAIQAAIKKHSKGDDDPDPSIREVDEKTIIDRVLSQKKKGKWSRK